MKRSWAPVSFALYMHYAYVIVLSCLCLLDAIVELHATDENMFNDFLIEKWK
jgi:hypothetical protein